MADANQINALARRAMLEIGRDLADIDTLAEQMVALESVVGGLFSLVMRLNGVSEATANGWLSALTHGVRDRLPKLMSPGAAG